MTVEEENVTVENQTKGLIKPVFCLMCKRSTRHLVSVSLDKNGSAWHSDEAWNVSWSETYQVLECQGCSTISFSHSSWFSEDEQDGEDGVVERLYPMRKQGNLIAYRY